MIKAALQYLVDLGSLKHFTIDGLTYSDHPLHVVAKPQPVSLTIHTLSGLVDYIHYGQQQGGDLDEAHEFIQIKSHDEVKLHSSLVQPEQARNCFVTVRPFDYKGFNFGCFMDLEAFIVEVQSKFVQDGTTTTLIKMASGIRDENVRLSLDDGISQEVSVRSGLALVEDVTVPNPVFLRPYRTFVDVEQPQSPFVFRLRKGGSTPVAALFEADGGLWKLNAVAAIQEFLQEKLLTDITIIS